jgi:cholesterol transport system auxiliary component
MNLRYFAVAGIASIVTACSIGRPPPTVTTYGIEPHPAASAALKPVSTDRLRVARVRVSAPYDRTALVYRLNGVRYISDPYHAFLSDPAPLLSNRISAWLSASELFRSVDGPGSAAPARWILEATVTDLYGDFETGAGAPAAVMSIHFTIIDESAARPKVAYESVLSRRVSVQSGSPDALVDGYGTALSDILTQFAKGISDQPLR